MSFAQSATSVYHSRMWEGHTLTGTGDAISKIVVRDHHELRNLLQMLDQAQDMIDRIQTCAVLEEFKNGPELPLPRAETKAAGE